MDQKDSIARWGILIAIVIAIGLGWAQLSALSKLTAIVQGQSGSSFGAVTPGTPFPHGINVGNPATLGVVPTNFSKILAGTGAIIGNTSQTASTTAAYDIAVTGVVPGDIVFAQQATSSPSYEGFVITGASASTTAGFITLQVFNANATAAVPNAIASSTKYIVLGTQ